MTKIIAVLCALAAADPALARCWKPGQTVSWYGEPQRVRSGNRFDPDARTCAHPTLPDGSLLRLVDLDTGRQAECVVNDHGPAPWTRCKVDVSRRVASEWGILGKGVARASIEVIRRGPSLTSRKEKSGAS